MGRARLSPTGEAASRPTQPLPSWLLSSQGYEPPRDRDGFVTRSEAAIASVLARLRLDDGQATALSPSAPVKLLLGLALIVLTSLSSNFAFTLAMLAATLARMCLLPAPALHRAAGVSLSASALTALVMLPATLLGQPQSALLVGTKVLVSVGIALIVALSTPAHEITASLRSLRVPNLAIMTVDLALKGIVTLGTVASEVLLALRLRSVGRNRDKAGSLGGTGGIVFLKAQRAAQDTADAMRCRGFEGEYPASPPLRPRMADVAWVAGLALCLALFCYLEGQV